MSTELEQAWAAYQRARAREYVKMDRIKHLTKLLKMSLIIIENEGLALECSQKHDKAVPLFRFVDDMKAEAQLKNLSL